MGNCLQGSETDDVNLLHSDNETVNVGARSPGSSSRENSIPRSGSQSSETSIGATHSQRSSRRSSSRRSNNGNGEQHRHRRSSDSGIRVRSTAVPPPSYEVATMHRSAATGSASIGPAPVYHPSPGVSRQASELTEEEQIKIAQRIGLIQHLPVDIYIDGKKSDTECVICMADFVEGDRVRFLPCMHTYHVNCIDEWLMRQFACPSCLEPVDSALLTSYDQLTALTDSVSGIDGDGGACRSLPRQLEQLTAITSPPSSVPLSEVVFVYTNCIRFGLIKEMEMVLRTSICDPSILRHLVIIGIIFTNSSGVYILLDHRRAM